VRKLRCDLTQFLDGELFQGFLGVFFLMGFY